MPAATVTVNLRDPFPASVVGKLPRVTCKACSDRTCNEHRKTTCAECGNWISERHIHLDYVGHAEVTDRLLSVDPTWTWEPFALDGKDALRRSDSGKELNLWISLTVKGVTRIGVGSVQAGSFDAEKQLIGDALRNAAMRFGVALDLWSKAELESAVLEMARPTTDQAEEHAQAAQESEGRRIVQAGPHGAVSVAMPPSIPLAGDRAGIVAQRFTALSTAQRNKVAKGCNDRNLPQPPWAGATSEELESIEMLLDNVEAAA